MASEKLDLIDRKELIKVAERKQFAIADNTHPYKAIMIQGMYFRGIVEDAPAVDAVKVVRCKDCKHYVWDEFDGSYVCLSIGRFVKPDFWCAHGERRTDG